MNTNFQVRRITGYDPGYPRARRRPGRLEARPLRFLFLVVGFLFFFVGFGCQNTGGSVDVGPDYDDQLAGVDETIPQEYDVVQPDYEGATAPDYYEQLSGADDPGFYEYDVVEPDDDEQLTDELIPDADGLLPDGDNIVCPVDEELTGVVAPDEMPDLTEAETPDYDDQLTGDSAPVLKSKK